MEIVKVNINELISPEYNPRQITDDEMEKLKNSINEFGYIAPIIVNKHNNHIVGGNQRYEALKSLGYTDVDVIFVDEPDLNREKALNIALNKISGEWDTEKLFVILEELEVNDFDLGLTGFDGFDEEIEIKCLLDKMEFREPNSESSSENSDSEIEDGDFDDEDNTGIGFYEITVLFDSEEEMTEAFDKLVEEGYNCRMSDS